MQRDSRFVKWKKVLGKKDLKDALTGVKPDPSGWTLKKGKNVACADGSVEGEGRPRPCTGGARGRDLAEEPERQHLGGGGQEPGAGSGARCGVRKRRPLLGREVKGGGLRKGHLP